MRLRGWDFPCDVADTTYNGQDFFGGFVDWQNHVEAWRLYSSGQFVYFGSPWDLAFDLQDRLRSEFERVVRASERLLRDEIPGFFSFVGLTYSITEFYLFANRLVTSLRLEDASFRVAMRNIDGWALTAGEPGVILHGPYQAHVNDMRIRAARAAELLADPVGTATYAICELFDVFNWSVDPGVIRNWQDRLISRRFGN